MCAIRLHVPRAARLADSVQKLSNWTPVGLKSEAGAGRNRQDQAGRARLAAGVRLALNRMHSSSSSSSVCRLPVVAPVVALYRIFHNRALSHSLSLSSACESAFAFSENCDTRQQHKLRSFVVLRSVSCLAWRPVVVVVVAVVL